MSSGESLSGRYMLLCHFDSLGSIKLPKNKCVVTFEMPLAAIMAAQVCHRTYSKGSFRQDALGTLKLS